MKLFQRAYHLQQEARTVGVEPNAVYLGIAAEETIRRELGIDHGEATVRLDHLFGMRVFVCFERPADHVSIGLEFPAPSPAP